MDIWGTYNGQLIKGQIRVIFCTICLFNNDKINWRGGGGLSSWPTLWTWLEDGTGRETSWDGRQDENLQSGDEGGKSDQFFLGSGAARDQGVYHLWPIIYRWHYGYSFLQQVEVQDPEQQVRHRWGCIVDTSKQPNRRFRLLENSRGPWGRCSSSDQPGGHTLNSSSNH